MSEHVDHVQACPKCGAEGAFAKAEKDTIAAATLVLGDLYVCAVCRFRVRMAASRWSRVGTFVFGGLFLFKSFFKGREAWQSSDWSALSWACVLSGVGFGLVGAAMASGRARVVTDADEEAVR